MLQEARRWLLALLLLAPWSGSMAAESAPLIFGLFPNLSPRTLVTIYQPMRDFLENELGQPVELVTATDFSAFTRRMLAKEYDLIVAAPHLARLGQVDAGYRLLFHYDQPIQAYLVVANDHSIRNLRDLTGKQVAIPDKMAIMAPLANEMLAQAGLRVDTHYRLVEARSHNNAALSVLNGQAGAAAIGSIPFQQLPAEVRNQLRVIGKSRSVASQYFAVSDRLTERERKRIAAALLRFAASFGGKAFFKRYGMGGITEAKPDELKEMDAFIKQMRQWLAEPAKP